MAARRTHAAQRARGRCVYLSGVVRRVLLVEDDDDLREMFAEVLRDAGYHVCEAENGQVALQRLEHELEPCLILLDLMMPLMSGYDLLRWLKRRSGRLASTPVVVLSAGGVAAQVPGADAFVSKPVSPEQLLNVVARYCANSQGGR
jgi:CheY-like chemotaxis protein